MTGAWLLGLGWGCVLAIPLLWRAGSALPRHRANGLGAQTIHRGWRRAWSLRRPTASRWGSVVHAVAERLRARGRTRAVERSMPMTLDVLTMAARAGCTPRLSIVVAAQWSPPAMSAVLAGVDRRCRLGASLVDALDHAGRAEPSLRSMTDTLAVAERSGAPIADLVARLADEARAMLRRRVEAHARRVPVRLLFPLVFLVLPAFGLLTVVPALLNGLRHT